MRTEEQRGVGRKRVYKGLGLPRDGKVKKVSGMMSRGATYFRVCHA